MHNNGWWNVPWKDVCLIFNDVWAHSLISAHQKKIWTRPHGCKRTDNLHKEFHERIADRSYLHTEETATTRHNERTHYTWSHRQSADHQTIMYPYTILKWVWNMTKTCYNSKATCCRSSYISHFALSDSYWSWDSEDKNSSCRKPLGIWNHRDRDNLCTVAGSVCFPCSTTSPVISCPRTHGMGYGWSLFMTCRSEWHTPHAVLPSAPNKIKFLW